MQILTINILFTSITRPVYQGLVAMLQCGITVQSDDIFNTPFRRTSLHYAIQLVKPLILSSVNSKYINSLLHMSYMSFSEEYHKLNYVSGM